MYFTLCHDAEDVNYEYNDFLYKDYDRLDENMVDFFKDKNQENIDPLIRIIYNIKAGENEGGEKKGGKKPQVNASLAKKF